MRGTSLENKSLHTLETNEVDDFKIMHLHKCNHDLLETSQSNIYSQSKMTFTRHDSIWYCSGCKKKFQLKELE